MVQCWHGDGWIGGSIHAVIVITPHDEQLLPKGGSLFLTDRMRHGIVRA
jgi:hypothetical protein